MRSKLWIILLCVAVIAVGTIACGGGGKYADAKKIIAKSNVVVGGFLEKMDSVDNAKDAASAMNSFTDEMEKIVPEMRELEKKYPELGGGQSVPEELGEEGKKMMELWGKFSSVMMKIQQFADDPEVQKAQERLQTVMAGL